jgi:integrase
MILLHGDAAMAFEQFAHWQVYDDAGRRKYLSSAERERFLEVADTLDLATGALCYTLAFTGCRISEALNLRRDQLDAERLTLTFKTLKRRRTVFRDVPIPAQLAGLLLSLPKQPDGRFWNIHRTTAWRNIKQAMERVGIAGPMACCKGLRHGFGIRAAGCNVPPNLIQRWMGHASSMTTAVYLDAVGYEERAFANRMW